MFVLFWNFNDGWLIIGQPLLTEQKKKVLLIETKVKGLTFMELHKLFLYQSHKQT